mgnify:CR=1 FL=1
MAETEFIERMLSMLPEKVSRHLRRYDTRGKGDAQEDMKAKGEYILAVIYVNGMRQYSASNRKYVSPKL